jgi:hypothetical protein
VCAGAPAAPTNINFSKHTGIQLGDEITATAEPLVTTGDKIPTKYNWTIPLDYFEITEGSGTRVIKLKANAAATITDAIKVNAQNDCGTSSNYSNQKTVTILNCSGAPALPGDISFSPESVEFGGTFTATINAVPDATSYTWTLTDGLTAISLNTTAPSITITGEKAGTYADGSIKVKANNDCGSSADKSSENAVIVNNPPCAYIIKDGAYRDHRIDTDSIIKFRDTAKLPTPMDELTGTYHFRVTGDLCLAANDQMSPPSTYTYNWDDAKKECNDLREYGFSDWRVPNVAELGNLQGASGDKGMLSQYYWSSDRRDGSAAHYWDYVNAVTGEVMQSYKTNVRCVRSLPAN